MNTQTEFNTEPEYRLPQASTKVLLEGVVIETGQIVCDNPYSYAILEFEGERYIAYSNWYALPNKVVGRHEESTSQYRTFSTKKAKDMYLQEIDKLFSEESEDV